MSTEVRHVPWAGIGNFAFFESETIDECRRKGQPVPTRETLLDHFRVCAKVNQFFENLGPPGPPRHGKFLTPSGVATRMGNLISKNIKLLIFIYQA